MNRKVSRAAIIGTMVANDLRAFKRDTMWVMLSVIGLLAYVIVFWIMPDTVNEAITIGVFQSDLDEIFEAYEQEESGLALVEFESEADLRAVIEGELEAWETPDGLYLRDKEAGEPRPEEGDRLAIGIGIAFPDDFMTAAFIGEPTTVTLYMDAAVPEEIRGAMTSFVREIAYGLRAAGSGHAIEQTLPIVLPDEDDIILGEDRAGDQVPIRVKMKPMFAFFVLMIEAFALSGLVATEVQSRTVTAVLVTPANKSDFLLAKGITGTLVAFVQAAIVLAAIGAFTSTTMLPMLVTLLIGSVMVTGIALWVGSAGKDFMGTLYYGMLALIPFVIPSLATLFPGTVSAWVRVLPSYGIIQALVDISAYGGSWAEIAPDLGISLAWLAVIMFGGVYSLKRKVASL